MYAIFLSSNSNINDPYENYYGYYEGKTYCVQGEYFPITGKGITEHTKIYKSEKVAKKSAESVFKKCSEVGCYEIRKVK